MKKVLPILLSSLFILSACNKQDDSFIYSSEEESLSSIESSEESSSEEIIDEGIKNIILIIGDGMGLEHIAAGQMVYNKTYDFTTWKNCVVNTDSATNGYNETLTDSAAAGTALATGHIVPNRYIAKDKDGNDLTTILDIAKANNKRTGIITTDKLTGATPAAFSAHTTDRGNSDEIIQTQLDSNVDLLVSRNSSSIRDAAPDFVSKGYTYHTDMETPLTNDEKPFCLFDVEENDSFESGVHLKDTISYCLDYMDADEDGFALMIEQAHIDKNSHNNDFEHMSMAMNSLNDTVETIIEWLGDRTDTAIIITADHETGGLHVSKDNTLESVYTYNDRDIYYSWDDDGHTRQYVGFFAYNLDDISLKDYSYYESEHLIKNADIFKIMKDLI